MVQGDTSKCFVVEDQGEQLGYFDMHDIMAAMVPQRAKEEWVG